MSKRKLLKFIEEQVTNRDKVQDDMPCCSYLTGGKGGFCDFHNLAEVIKDYVEAGE